METSVLNEPGAANFIMQLDGVGTAVLLILLLMSMASWYLIVSKAIANVSELKRADVFLREFWEASSLQHFRSLSTVDDTAFAALARKASSVNPGDSQGVPSLLTTGGLVDYLTRVLRNAIEQEAARVEGGLTFLASVGASAPFLGLFGTVWGIYQALVQIGLSGQGTLEKVAGPVGEALIMTAIGLAVAIPAVLAYNSFTRRNRVWLANLENFAHDLYKLVVVSRSYELLAPGGK